MSLSLSELKKNGIQNFQTLGMDFQWSGMDFLLPVSISLYHSNWKAVMRITFWIWGYGKDFNAFCYLRGDKSVSMTFFHWCKIYNLCFLGHLYLCIYHVYCKVISCWYKSMIFNLIIQNSSLCPCCEIAPMWRPQKIVNEQSTLIQGMTWFDPDLFHYMVSLGHNELNMYACNYI